MRELQAMLKQISKRRHNELVMEASFHGIKIPMWGQTEPSEKPSLSEAEVTAMDKAMAEAKFRKAQEFAQRYGK